MGRSPMLINYCLVYKFRLFSMVTLYYIKEDTEKLEN